MSIAELETAVRLGLGLLVVVYNDAAYGAEVHHFGPDGARRWTTVRFPDDRPRRDRPRLRLRRPRPSAHPDDLAAVGRLAGRSARPADGGRREDHAGRPSWWLEEAFRGH